MPTEGLAIAGTIGTMLLVGLTGGIGSGKSTVARYFAQCGAVIVDVDQAARAVVQSGEPAFLAVVERFGGQIVGPDGELDRPALAAIVFADSEARRDLERITHPAMGAEMMRQIGEAPENAVVVVDAPLLVESKQQGMYAVVVVVEAPREVRLDRLVERGLTREDAAARMAAQATDEERRAVADFVVDNSSDLHALEAALDVVWGEIVRRRELT